MNALWIVAAFIFGAVSGKIGMPPLVGYLAAGFALNSMGVAGGETLEQVANAGVTLLLFTIGLKLKLKDLAKPVVWCGATLHMGVTVVVFGAAILALSAVEAPFFKALNGRTALLLAFALSFSSTVFAVKVFEGKKEMSSRHADAAIGILIMQDLFAVIFLAASTGKVPSPWAVVLIGALLLIRPFLGRFMVRCGHGELLMLFGILMAAAGYGSFEYVGLKGDLGALVFGMLLASHPKASELAGHLLSFKNLFLVGFFLNIGISGAPTLAGLGLALCLALAVPFKTILFFAVLTRFRMRARTAMLSSFSLSNYSEFGLIVGSIGVSNGWISSAWLIYIALALSLSFVMAAPLNASAHSIYERLSGFLKRFERTERLPGDERIDAEGLEIAVLGMGGVGTAAYDEMRARHGDVVLGIDFGNDAVALHRRLGRRVVFGDANDSDFWARFDPANTSIELVMLALPDPEISVFTIRQLQRRGYQGQIAASVRYEDEKRILREAGIDAAYSLYEEAGVGFANHVCDHMDHCRLQDAGLTS